jgi:hypothetical protein
MGGVFVTSLGPVDPVVFRKQVEADLAKALNTPSIKGEFQLSITLGDLSVSLGADQKRPTEIHVMAWKQPSWTALGSAIFNGAFPPPRANYTSPTAVKQAVLRVIPSGGSGYFQSNPAAWGPALAETLAQHDIHVRSAQWRGAFTASVSLPGTTTVPKVLFVELPLRRGDACIVAKATVLGPDMPYCGLCGCVGHHDEGHCPGRLGEAAATATKAALAHVECVRAPPKAPHQEGSGATTPTNAGVGTGPAQQGGPTMDQGALADQEASTGQGASTSAPMEIEEIEEGDPLEESPRLASPSKRSAAAIRSRVGALATNQVVVQSHVQTAPAWNRDGVQSPPLLAGGAAPPGDALVPQPLRHRDSNSVVTVSHVRGTAAGHHRDPPPESQATGFVGAHHQ